MSDFHSSPLQKFEYETLFDKISCTGYMTIEQFELILKKFNLQKSTIQQVLEIEFFLTKTQFVCLMVILDGIVGGNQIPKQLPLDTLNKIKQEKMFWNENNRDTPINTLSALQKETKDLQCRVELLEKDKNALSSIKNEILALQPSEIKTVNLIKSIEKYEQDLLSLLNSFN